MLAGNPKKRKLEMAAEVKMVEEREAKREMEDNLESLQHQLQQARYDNDVLQTKLRKQQNASKPQQKPEGWNAEMDGRRD